MPEKSFLDALRESFKGPAERAGAKRKKKRRKVGFLGSKLKREDSDKPRFISSGDVSRENLRRRKSKNGG